MSDILPDTHPTHIAHLLTFLLMVDPRLTTMRWSNASIQKDHVYWRALKSLSLYYSDCITQLQLSNVSFGEASCFKSLLCALPNLQVMVCHRVSCAHNALAHAHESRAASDELNTPRGCTRLCELIMIDTEVVVPDIIAELTAGSPINKLTPSMRPHSRADACQRLLNAHCGTIRDLRINIIQCRY